MRTVWGRYVALAFLVIGGLLPGRAEAQYDRSGGPRRDWAMFQGAISGGVMFDSGTDEEIPPQRDDFGFGSIYVGMAFMPAPPPVTPFFGAGIEGTVAGGRGPYQLSFGAGTRMGVAWRWTNHRYTLPDLYVYLKLMPFIGTGSFADEDYLGRPVSVQRTGAGLRAAVGFTAPAWTAFWYSDGNAAVGAIGVAAAARDADEAAICCIGFLLAGILNHMELTYEGYATDSEDLEHRIGVRVGVGF